MKPHRVGIDLGGTKVEAILLDPGGHELFRRRVATPGSGPDRYGAIREAVCGLVGEALALAGRETPCTVGVGIPGVVDRQTRLVQNANTTCLIGRPFLDDLQERLGRAVGMENDANCFVLAESRQGAAQGFDRVVGIILGSGCGGGICQGGEIVRGRHGIAGEWGHFSVDPAGAACFCGNRGCVETKISGNGVEDAYYRRHGRRLPMADIVAGYRGGDPCCSETFDGFLDDFGRCLGGLVSILDPDVVVIGGGLSHIDELYTVGADRVRRYAFHPDLTTPIRRNVLGDSAGVFGAAWLGRM